MIYRLCEEGLLDETRELLVKMKQNGCLPNDVTFNIIVRGFLKRNRCYDTLVFLEEMIGSGFSPDASSFPMLVDLFSAKGQDPSLLEMIKKFMP